MSVSIGAAGDPVVFREQVLPSDRESVRRIVDSTGVFHQAEVDVAVELVEQHLQQGAASGYYFVFAERGGQTAGYACFGPIACTASSYDLYWIAVDKSCQNQGLGRLLLEESQRRIEKQGGRRVYVDTSGRDQYLPTRTFYEKSGYRREATLADFYAPGDDKVIYLKVLC